MRDARKGSGAVMCKWWFARVRVVVTTPATSDVAEAMGK